MSGRGGSKVGVHTNLLVTSKEQAQPKHNTTNHRVVGGGGGVVNVLPVGLSPKKRCHWVDWFIAGY